MTIRLTTTAAGPPIAADQQLGVVLCSSEGWYIRALEGVATIPNSESLELRLKPAILPIHQSDLSGSRYRLVQQPPVSRRVGQFQRSVHE